jgi:hypothetical protein
MISDAAHDSTLRPKESFTFNTARPEGSVVVGIGVGADTSGKDRDDIKAHIGRSTSKTHSNYNIFITNDCPWFPRIAEYRLYCKLRKLRGHCDAAVVKTIERRASLNESFEGFDRTCSIHLVIQLHIYVARGIKIYTPKLAFTRSRSSS